MKRDHRLVPLSREHHAALRLGRQLMAGGAGAALRAQLDTLTAHFAEEERRVLPLLHAHGKHPLARRLREEHVMLLDLFDDALHGEPEAEIEAGRALIGHVRFEERELFPAVEILFAGARPTPPSHSYAG